jgi:CheY-like chemotaxis protein
MHRAVASMLEPFSVRMAAGLIPADEALHIVRRAAAALTTVHGELSPSAILLDGPRVSIAPTGTTDRARYSQYSAPEVLLGGTPTAASDVFSLGAILFHALAGYAPFRGESPTALRLSICSGAPRSLPAAVPRPVAEAIGRCLARDAQARFAAPAVLKHALEALTTKEGAWRGRRILLADDESAIRDAYGELAVDIGVEADIVSSGRDVIAALKTRRYDLALMDLNMPRISGWEVLDYLRGRYDQRPARLFIVTGFADLVVGAADREVVNAVLYKPVAGEEVRTLVTACLRGGDVDLPSILRTTGHRATPAA